MQMLVLRGERKKSACVKLRNGIMVEGADANGFPPLDMLMLNMIIIINIDSAEALCRAKRETCSKSILQNIT
jgi:hypothetical protein